MTDEIKAIAKLGGKAAKIACPSPGHRWSAQVHVTGSDSRNAGKKKPIPVISARNLRIPKEAPLLFSSGRILALLPRN
jgi:hypothetical protein